MTDCLLSRASKTCPSCLTKRKKDRRSDNQKARRSSDDQKSFRDVHARSPDAEVTVDRYQPRLTRTLQNTGGRRHGAAGPNTPSNKRTQNR
jgi:hypothetical protein